VEKCDLRRDCRPGDFGESAIGKNGPGVKQKKQETVRGVSGQNQQTPTMASIKAKNIIAEGSSHFLMFILSAPV
jgi:hypothetical protein